MTGTLPVRRGDDIVVTEGKVNATFTVTLSSTSGQVATVNYATVNSMATAGNDFLAGSGTVTFSVGSTTPRITLVFNVDLFSANECRSAKICAKEVLQR